MSLQLALQKLRAYLDTIGFHGIYKYAKGLNFYFVTPHDVNTNTGGALRPLEAYVSGRLGAYRLLACLVANAQLEMSTLSAEEQNVAAALVPVGLLQRDGVLIKSAGYKLISAQNLYLFTDTPARLGMHETYIGIDSYLLLYYMDMDAISAEYRVLDLGTGTGVVGLTLSTLSHHVTATDVAEHSLFLARVNCALNGREERVTLRNEDLRETLERHEQYDILTCNPPFVAFPADIKAPLFAQGDGEDGLGYLRLLFEKLPGVLSPRGRAYFVADLIGDDHEPYFLQTLTSYAQASALAIDVYIDGRLPARAQIKPLAMAVQPLNPDKSLPQLMQAIETFLADTLRARFYYLSTIKVVPDATPPGVRVLNRYRT